MLRMVAPALLTALFLVAGCTKQDAANPHQTGANPNNAAAGKVELVPLDYDGVQKLIQSHQGKVVVLDCWSTSCDPCVEEFPGLVALHKQHADQVACISLNLDYIGIGKPEEYREPVLAFLQKQGATFDNVLSTEADEEITKKFGFAAIPVVFVYDRQGKLLKRFDNEAAEKKEDLFTYEDVSALVAEQLKK